MNKVTFKKDAIETFVTLSFEMKAQSDEDPHSWDLLRKGHVSIRTNIQLKMLGESKIYYKVEGGIKALRLLDKEGEQMDIEEDAIKGIVNLMIKRKLQN